MAGQLDSVFKNVAKQVIADLGSSFNHTITFIKKECKVMMWLMED